MFLEGKFSNFICAIQEGILKMHADIRNLLSDGEKLSDNGIYRKRI